MDFFGPVFFIVFIVFAVALYLFICYTLYRIGRKFQIGSFPEYCIPFYNAYLIWKCAGAPLWNLIGIFLPIIGAVNAFLDIPLWNFMGVLVSIFSLVCSVNIWGKIAQRLGKNYWLYGILTTLFFIPAFILAFDSSYPVGYETEYETLAGPFARLDAAKEQEAEERGLFTEQEETDRKEYAEAFEDTATAKSPFEETEEDTAKERLPFGATEETTQENVAERKQYKKRRSLSSALTSAPLLGSFFVKQFNELVGVDIGTTTIKVCSLKNNRGLFTVENVILKTYDQDLLNDGHIVDIDFIANELRGVFEENKIKSRNVACALSSYSVISKKISIPLLQEEELERTINVEVENAIPFPMRDIYYSYHVMGIDAEKQNMMNVKIVAAKKEIVDAYVAAFNMADLTLHILDVDIFDISNMVEQIYNPKEHSVVVVDIGASVTNIAILNGEEIEFTREILVGGKYLTSLIQKSVRIDYNEAERKKLSADTNVAYLFEDFIFNIASEINKTIRFYLATKPKEDIGRIYVTGGSSLLPGLKEKIVEDTGIQVEVINPFLLAGGVQNEAYENMKEFMAVPLYLSTRITDLQI